MSWYAPFAVLQQADGQLVLAGAGNPDGDFDDDLLIVRLNGDGSLDPTFSTDGIASADFGGSDDSAFAVIQRRDGKLVVAGNSLPVNQGYDLALARFNAEGTLDSTFGDRA